MAQYKLDTENAGCDEILTGESVEAVTQDILNRYECDELPAGREITQVPAVELAVKDEHSAWELLGDYPTTQEAKDAAKEYAGSGQYHIDDHGVMVFGISEDPASGQYETSYSVDVESGEAW